MAWIKTFFQLSSGLEQTIKVPPGTCAALKKHFEAVTKTLDLKVSQFKDNPPHWEKHSPSAHVPNHIASDGVFGHNRLVRKLYYDLARWAEAPPDEYEELTPAFAKTIWYGFSFLQLNYDRWTADVYHEEMEVLFDVMQGKETDGITFGEDNLTDKQAAAVISLFSMYFDKDDVRLELPNDCGFLVTSDQIYWCPAHGAWRDMDVYLDEEDQVICPVDGCDEVIG